MKKAKFIGLLALCFALAAAPCQAQTKKSASTSKSTTTTTKRTSTTSSSGTAFKVEGKTYGGIIKIDPNSPIYLWCTMSFGDNNAVEVDLAGNDLKSTYKFASSANTSLSITLPNGNLFGTFTSKDKGLTLNGKTMNNSTSWFVKWPKKFVEYSGDKAEITEYLTEKDGYTCFYLFEANNGTTLAAECSLTFTDDTFSMHFDTAEMQKLFSDSTGTWSLDGDKITMTDQKGREITGTVYNNGNFIRFGLGSMNIPNAGRCDVYICLTK